MVPNRQPCDAGSSRGSNSATIGRVKIVVDTNVFVGACMGVGASNRVIAACVEKRSTPLMGTALFAEYEDVLGREALFDGCRLKLDEREELLDIFLSACEWTRIHYGWRPNLPDEGDNHLVELAIAGGAEFVVTRNLRDLSRMELRFPSLTVLDPEAFLQELSV